MKIQRKWYKCVGSAFRHSQRVKCREVVYGNALLLLGFLKAESGKFGSQRNAGARREEGIVSDAYACGQYATIMHTEPCDAVDEAVLLRLSCHSLEDTGGTRLKYFPDRKEANHGGDTSMVDEGRLVRRVKLRYPLSVRVRTATDEQSL